jgi:RNA polymerase sigma factor (sigma-70 family)
MSSTEFDHLILSSNNAMRAYALKLTKNLDAAKDLCQETFCRAFSNRDKYLPDTNIKAWLLTIMYHTFVNTYRRHGLGIKYVSYCMEHQRNVNDQNMEMEHIETGLYMKDLQLAVFNLPEIFRNVLQLYCNGYKYVEIANIIDEPIGTVKSRIHIARKLLKMNIGRS